MADKLINQHNAGAVFNGEKGDFILRNQVELVNERIIGQTFFDHAPLGVYLFSI